MRATRRLKKRPYSDAGGEQQRGLTVRPSVAGGPPCRPTQSSLLQLAARRGRPRAGAPRPLGEPARGLSPVQEIAPGLWHWTALRESIGSDVSSYYLAEERVAIDPMLPPEPPAWFPPLRPPHLPSPRPGRVAAGLRGLGGGPGRARARRPGPGSHLRLGRRAAGRCRRLRGRRAQPRRDCAPPACVPGAGDRRRHRPLARRRGPDLRPGLPDGRAGADEGGVARRLFAVAGTARVRPPAPRPRRPGGRRGEGRAAGVPRLL